MKKTTIKVSWDNAQAVKRIAMELSETKKEVITQDQALRYLIDKYNKK